MRPDQIEAYLRSDEAAREMASALGDTFHRGPWSVIAPGVFGWIDGFSYAYDETHCDPIRVYFRELRAEDIPADSPNFLDRPESPVGCYTVTDLGDGVRALKLRTGVMEGGAAINDALHATTRDILGERVSFSYTADGVKSRVLWTWNGGDLYLPAVAPADLPRRLCQVLLASYRIARLEMPARAAGAS